MSEQRRCRSSCGLGKYFYLTGGCEELLRGEVCPGAGAGVRISALPGSSEETMGAKGLV